jgi:hypothetical protein
VTGRRAVARSASASATLEQRRRVDAGVLGLPRDEAIHGKRTNAVGDRLVNIAEIEQSERLPWGGRMTTILIIVLIILLLGGGGGYYGYNRYGHRGLGGVLGLVLIIILILWLLGGLR